MRRRSAARRSTARDDAGAGLRLEVIDRLDIAELLAPEWDALADVCEAGPFARPAYALGWWRHLGKGRLLVATVRDDADGGRLLALAPLHERPVGPVRVARWLGHGLGTIAEVLVHPGREDAVGVLWEGLAVPHRVLELVECRETLPGLDVLRAVPARTTRAAARDVCPVAEIDPAAPLAHLAGRPQRSLRESLRSKDRKVVKDGHVLRFEAAESLESLELLLPDVRRVFDAAEESQARLHLLRPPWEEFVLGFLRETVPVGRGVVIVGYLDERPINFNVALVDASTLHFWIGRYDPVARQYGPGNLMLRESYAWAGRRGLTRADLLLGDADYKRYWATGSYETTEVHSATRWASAVAREAERAASRVRGRR